MSLLLIFEKKINELKFKNNLREEKYNNEYKNYILNIKKLGLMRMKYIFNYFFNK